MLCLSAAYIPEVPRAARAISALRSSASQKEQQHGARMQRYVTSACLMQRERAACCHNYARTKCAAPRGEDKHSMPLL